MCAVGGQECVHSIRIHLAPEAFVNRMVPNFFGIVVFDRLAEKVGNQTVATRFPTSSARLSKGYLLAENVKRVYTVASLDSQTVANHKLPERVEKQAASLWER